MKKSALITGITGQDGKYLAELLLDKGYMVHGIKRRSSSLNTDRVDHLYNNPKFKLHYGDLTDSMSICNLIKKIEPDEIYNLGAQSHVKVSFELPEYTMDVDAIGPLRLLESIRILGMEQHCKYYQASTSEMFGKVQTIPQNEETPFYPRSPYGVAKLAGHWITKNYRESYSMFACSGILFNHESPVRGETFVTRKITMGVAKQSTGQKHIIKLGNLNAQRDWGHAKDYVDGMWRMLQHDVPDDYVLATGKMTSVKEFCEMAYFVIGKKIEWTGEGLHEVAIDKQTGKILVCVDPMYYRPAEVDELLGDCTKAKTILGWSPKYDLSGLVEDMVLSDIQKLKIPNDI